MATANSPSSSSSDPPVLSEAQIHSALHVHARGANKAYPSRQHVADDKVPWKAPFSQYSPPDFTSDNVLKNSKDPTDPRLIPSLSSRASFEAPELQLCSEGRPLNPHGRTGLRGRGKLYQWGPNHAADPLASRRSQKGDGDELEIVVIKRGDSGAWALPGGMVDPGEEPLHAASREFGEEAMAHTDPALRRRAHSILPKIFDEARVQRVYSGYIDDPRNTDNSWIESSVFHAHLDDALAADLSPLLHAGDDAAQVKWLRAVSDEPDMRHLYASHLPIVMLAVQRWKDSQKGKQQQGGTSTPGEADKRRT